MPMNWSNVGEQAVYQGIGMYGGGKNEENIWHRWYGWTLSKPKKPYRKLTVFLCKELFIKGL